MPTHCVGAFKQVGSISPRHRLTAIIKLHANVLLNLQALPIAFDQDVLLSAKNVLGQIKVSAQVCWISTNRPKTESRQSVHSFLHNSTSEYIYQAHTTIYMTMFWDFDFFW